MTNNTEKIMSDGNPTIAKSVLSETENRTKRYIHIGIIGLINNLLDIKMQYTFPDDSNSAYS